MLRRRADNPNQKAKPCCLIRDLVVAAILTLLLVPEWNRVHGQRPNPAAAPDRSFESANEASNQQTLGQHDLWSDNSTAFDDCSLLPTRKTIFPRQDAATDESGLATGCGNAVWLQPWHPTSPTFFDGWLDPVQLGYRSEPRQWTLGACTHASLWANARALFSDDLRIEFTGQEASFSVEGQLLGSVVHEQDGYLTSLTAEFYLNQPFDRNLLTDYSLRESFSHNFDIDTFEISQLFVSVDRGPWAIDLGRFVTPFGRYYAPQLTNRRSDAPFIRTEAILFRETGLQLRFRPGPLRLAAALTNGSDGRDTNSSKAIVARTGFETTDWVAGASIKWQDGIGSEGQKEFNRHVGIDLAFRRGRWLLSTEWIYDQYGLRRPGTPLDAIDWGRSIYNRQLNNGLNRPLTGWGWYANAIRQGPRSMWVCGYGEFHPNPIGDRIHDTVTRRLLVKWIRPMNDRLDFFASGLFENELDNAQGGRNRKGVFVLGGLQFHF